MQEPPSRPEWPGWQAHDARDVLLGDEVEFGGQLVHSAAPTDGLKVPAPHAWQAPPLGPEKPGLHLHDARDALPFAEVAFGGQSVHMLAAIAGENVPLAHGVHVALPTDGLKLPAAHAWHEPPLCPV